MALQKLTLKPGVNKEGTNYANENGFYNSDKIRFRSGYAEKIGGWINDNVNSTYKGIARSLFNWASLTTQNLLGVFTSQKVYVQNSSGGTYHDITPLRKTVTLGTNPFYTNITAGVNYLGLLVKVTYTAHGATAGTYVTFSGATTFNGVTLNGEFEIIDVLDINTFTIISPTLPSGTGSGGGSAVVAAFQMNAGGGSFSTLSGWGAGSWGGVLGDPTTGWGSSVISTTSVPFRLWSESNYDEDLIMAPRNGSIYYWTKDTTTFARAITLNDKANTVEKIRTTASWASGAFSITVTDNTGIDIGSVISGTSNIPTGAYVTETYAGGLIVPISAATTGVGSAVELIFSYAGRHIPVETLVVTTSSQNAFTIAFGATPYDPYNFSSTSTFDPLLVRWSDQDNPFEWVPANTNQSGEQRLANGSAIIAVANTRQEILIWTDTALYTMQYLGPPYVFGINLLGDNISIASPNSVVTSNNITYWMGMDRFYTYSGRVDTLPCTLRQWVFGNINTAQLAQVCCGLNAGFNEVWWFYPTADSQINNAYVIYNYLEQTWVYGELPRTAWLYAQLRGNPIAAYSVQNSYLNSDVTTSQTTITLLDGNSYPTSGTLVIGSEQITYTGRTNNSFTGCTRGANSTTAATHIAYTAATNLIPNCILNHEIGYDDSSTSNPVAIPAYIESSDFDIGDGLNFAYVWRILPDLTFSGSTVSAPQCQLTVKVRQNSGAAYTPHSSDTKTVVRTATYPVEQYTGQVYVRVRGRQMGFRMASVDLGVFWQMGMMRIDVRQDGQR